MVSLSNDLVTAASSGECGKLVLLISKFLLILRVAAHPLVGTNLSFEVQFCPIEMIEEIRCKNIPTLGGKAYWMDLQSSCIHKRSSWIETPFLPRAGGQQRRRRDIGSIYETSRT